MLQKILSLFYFTYLGRSIGPENIGGYIFALSYVGIFGIFIDLGLGPILTREISKYPEKAKNYVQNILTAKLVLTVVSLVALYLVLQLLLSFDFVPIPVRTQHMVYLATTIIVLDSFTFTFFSLFRAWQQIHFEAVAVVIYQIVIVLFGVIFILLDKPTIYFIIAVLIGSVFNFFYSFILFLRRGHVPFGLSFHWPTIKKLAMLSLPFAFAGIFFKLAGSIDQNMLELLAGERYVGWYGVAFKLTFALTVLPGAFATSFFPVMSRYYPDKLKELLTVFERAMFYLMVISLPITIGIWVVGKEIVVALYKEAFTAAGDALYIFAFGLIFVFLNYPVGNLLNAAHRQVRNTVHMGIALVVNVILNLLLIPRSDIFGTYIGATIAAVASSVVLLFLGLPVVGQIVQYNKRLLLKKFFQILAASSAMGGCLWLLKNQVPLPLIVALGPPIYIFFLILTHSMSIMEIKSLVRSVLKRSA